MTRPIDELRAIINRLPKPIKLDVVTSELIPPDQIWVINEAAAEVLAGASPDEIKAALEPEAYRIACPDERTAQKIREIAGQVVGVTLR